MSDVAALSLMYRRQARTARITPQHQAYSSNQRRIPAAGNKPEINVIDFSRRPLASGHLITQPVSAPFTSALTVQLRNDIGPDSRRESPRHEYQTDPFNRPDWFRQCRQRYAPLNRGRDISYPRHRPWARCDCRASTATAAVPSRLSERKSVLRGKLRLSSTCTDNNR